MVQFANFPERPRSSFDRALRATSGATLGALGSLLVVAALDCAAARPGAHYGGRWLADLGLLAPLSLLVAALLASVRWLFHEGAAPRPRVALARWRALDGALRARWNARGLLLPLCFALWLIASANLATRLLGTDVRARAVGAAIALSALALFWIFTQLLDAATAVLAASPHVARIDPILAVSGGVCVAFGLMAYAVWIGTPSGAGGSLQLFGVLKRPELDLRAPGLISLLSLSAYVAPQPRSRSSAFGVLLLGVGSLSFTVRAARHGLEQRAVALSIERAAPLGKVMLAQLRKLTDHDHDGFSASFAGGDCDDRDPRRNPGASDIPENGIDEDCSGRDEPRPEPSAERRENRSEEAALNARKALPEHLNVVLISIDTLRQDVSSPQSARSITPNLDRLSGDSVVFDRAYALASYTAKSVGPFLLGKYSSETHRDWSHFNRFSSKDVFVAQRLQRANVHTVSVQGYWYFFMNTGLERGFDVINKSAAPKLVTVDGDSNSNGDQLSDAAIAELSKPELLQQPFFVWIHYVDPHAEYVAHPGFDFGSSSRARYDGEVAFVDQQVGRVLDVLEKSLVYDRTAIIVTSDHGEAFAEHGMIRHGFELWEELVRVPLIVRVPGVAARHVQTRRSAIDLAPTILDLCGVPAPAPSNEDFLSGTSLVPDLFTPAGQEPRARPIFIDMAAGPNNAERQALIDGDKKLVESGGRALSLFDLQADPGETKDLVDDPTEAAPMIERFKAYRRRLHEVYVKPE